ncbi:hypothetical protein HUJ04_006973 [Dendroctonus ponderosae]|nr:hypothetical protein HUJ04_006973 [Dendroctonus ponderosae]
MVEKVKHSQKPNAKALRAWCIITKDGTVANGHCTCMAGNSEVCSHIGALLFLYRCGLCRPCPQKCQLFH